MRYKGRLFATIAIILSVLLITNTSLSQSIEVRNSRVVIQNVGNKIADLNIRVDTSKIKKLGFKNIDELNLLGTKKPTHISSAIEFAPMLAASFTIFSMKTFSSSNQKITLI